MMGSEENTDELRHRILEQFRHDGRASYAAVAERLGVARHQVAAVVRQSVAGGELRFTTSISPDLLGLERFAYLQLTINGELKTVRKALVEMPETTFVADITGDRPLDAEVRVGPDPHLRDTVDAIKRIAGVRSVKVHLYDRIERNVFSPLRTGRSTISVDEIDRRMMQVLQHDGRASFRVLGDRAGVSASGARLRLERLLNAGVVKIVGIPVRGDTPGPPSIGAGIRACGGLDQAIAEVTSLNPEFLAVTLGEYDLIATLAADTHEELIVLMDAVRGLPSVDSVETWANIRVIKEQYGESDRLLTSADTDRVASLRDTGPA